MQEWKRALTKAMLDHRANNTSTCTDIQTYMSNSVENLDCYTNEMIQGDKMKLHCMGQLSFKESSNNSGG